MPNPARPATPVTWLLLIANLACFGLETQLSDSQLSPLLLWPLGPQFEPWQVITSAFLHGGPLHLATNMWGLWMFGREVEAPLGWLRFLGLYLASVVSAALTQVAVTTALGQNLPTLGASGGVFGILAAFAMLYPRRIIVLLIPPVPLPARWFVALYALVELFSGVYGTMSGIAHFAHLGGLAGGLLVTRSWLRRRRAEG